MDSRNLKFIGLLRSYFYDKICSEEFKLLKKVVNKCSEADLYTTLNEHWNEFDKFDELSDEKKKALWGTIDSRIGPNVQKRVPFMMKFRPYMSKVAAAVILLVMGTWSVFLSIDNYRMQVYAERDISISSGDLGRSKVVLPDGSSVHLNAKSVLSYQASFGKVDRRVRLSGEGLFQVKKDSGKEFVVEAGQMNIVVKGTTFNVSAYESDEVVEMALVEGRVQVDIDSSPYDSFVVSPNQKVVFNKKTGRMKLMQTDAQKEIVWLIDNLQFHKTKMRDVFEQLEHKYHVKFKYEDVDFLDDTYSGAFDNKRIEGVLFVLKQHYHFEYTMKENVITIMVLK